MPELGRQLGPLDPPPPPIIDRSIRDFLIKKSLDQLTLFQSRVSPPITTDTPSIFHLLAPIKESNTKVKKTSKLK